MQLLLYQFQLQFIKNLQSIPHKSNFTSNDEIQIEFYQKSKFEAFEVNKIIGSKPKVLLLGTELLAWSSSPDEGQRLQGVTPNRKLNSISTNIK